MKTQKTAEEILETKTPHSQYENFYHVDDILDSMHEFADQRYTPTEVMAIMEKVRDECIFQFTDAMGTQEIDLNEYLTK